MGLKYKNNLETSFAISKRALETTEQLSLWHVVLREEISRMGHGLELQIVAALGITTFFFGCGEGWGRLGKVFGFVFEGGWVEEGKV